MFKSIFVAIGLMFAALAGATPVQAQTSEAEFEVHSNVPYDLRLVFYSEGRQISPSDPQRAYRLSAGSVETFTMRCSFLEFVCYGAESLDGRMTAGRSMRGQSSECDYNPSRCCLMCGMEPSIRIEIDG
ncbi:MAG: hypothetical protein WD046_05495 [Paracoccaceae bacterium]